MAKSKGSKKTVLVSALTMIAGAAVANKVTKINLPLPIPEKAKPLLPVVLGYLLSRKGGTMGNLGMGMMIGGGIKAIDAFVPSLGIGSGEGISDYMLEMNGVEDYALNGINEGISAGHGSYALAGNSDSVNADMFG